MRYLDNDDWAQIGDLICSILTESLKKRDVLANVAQQEFNSGFENLVAASITQLVREQVEQRRQLLN